jgi:hypothetical protein
MHGAIPQLSNGVTIIRYLIEHRDTFRSSANGGRSIVQHLDAGCGSSLREGQAACDVSRRELTHVRRGKFYFLLPPLTTQGSEIIKCSSV